MVLTRGFGVAGALAWVCAAGAAAQPGTASKSVPFEWSAERRLVWSDFLGRPDLMTDASALTAYTLSFQYECSADGFFSYRVASLFLPDRSWVKAALLLRPGGESRRVLQHEQAHFDLSEVYARRFRRAVRALADPCSRSREEMQAIATQHVTEDFERQHRYDRETIYGLDTRRQGHWDATIDKELEALKAYVH